MAESKLATLYVEFISKGMDESTAAAAGIQAGLERAEKAAKALDLVQKSLADGSAQKLINLSVQLQMQQEQLARAEQFARLVAQYGQVGARVIQLQQGLAAAAAGAERLAKNVAAVSTGLARGILGALGSLTGMAQAISEGTVEGDRLGQSMTYLKRVLADDLAPYVRMLTQGIIELANWWRDLDGQTKRNIATWVAVGAAIVALVSLAPVVASAFSVAAGLVGAAATVMSAAFTIASAAATLMWTAIGGPVAIVVAAVVAGVAAIGAAVGGYYLYNAAKAGQLSEFMKSSNESWVDYVFRLIEWLGEKFITFFNWLSDQWGKTVDWIAKKVAQFGEMIGQVPAGTADMLDKMEATQGPKLSVEKWKAALGGLRNWIRESFDVNRLFPGLQGLQDALNRIKNAGQGGGFHIKFDVQFESLQGTWDRLQKAFASKEGANLQQQQLNKLDQANQNLQLIVAGVGRLAPAVQ